MENDLAETVLGEEFFQESENEFNKNDIPERLRQDLKQFIRNQPDEIKEFQSSKDKNAFHFTAIIVPSKVSAYKGGAFKIKIYFPDTYPFQPPKIIFQTRIYHPNIDARGFLSLRMIWPSQWNHTKTLTDVMFALLELINNPVVQDAICIDATNEFIKDPEKFNRKVQMYIRKFCKS